MKQISITPLNPAQTGSLIKLAHRIWHAHYPGIISVEQIDYMLASGYTDEIIRKEMAEGIAWLTINDGAEMIGFISAGPYGRDCIKLHKLYLLQEYHGRGIGALALSEVERLAASKHIGKLVLNVNKQNIKSIRAYERAGWVLAKEVVNDIGKGFVMDDYVMTKNISIF